MFDRDSKYRSSRRLTYVQEHSAEVYDIRQATAKKRAAFTANAIRLDDTLKDERGHERENALLSDGGRGAEVIRAVGETIPWLVEFNRVVDSLSYDDRIILDEFGRDYCPARAAKRAQTNRQRIYRLLARLREDLALAYQLKIHGDC